MVPHKIELGHAVWHAPKQHPQKSPELSQPDDDDDDAESSCIYPIIHTHTTRNQYQLITYRAQVVHKKKTSWKKYTTKINTRHKSSESYVVDDNDAVSSFIYTIISLPMSVEREREHTTTADTNTSAQVVHQKKNPQKKKQDVKIWERPHMQNQEKHVKNFRVKKDSTQRPVVLRLHGQMWSEGSYCPPRDA